MPRKTASDPNKMAALGCPFCGSDDLIVTNYDRFFRVECNACGAYGPSCTDDERSSRSLTVGAIASWNSSMKRMAVFEFSLPPPDPNYDEDDQ